MKLAAIVVGFNHWYGDTKYDKRFTCDFVTRLAADNPELEVLLVDNFSHRPYPTDIAPNVTTTRLLRRVGYALALNHGLQLLSDRDDYDWYVCFNNDCWIDPLHPGRITDLLRGMDPRVLYGSGENRDDRRRQPLQWSAWLCISREIYQAVGEFDPGLSAAFEDFDYQLRALQLGFRLETAHFPIIHLDEHTRLEDRNYPADWNKARLYFSLKHHLETDEWFKV